ncbi:hypothetical protein [Acinetobacter pittii]|uniref:hypothetical protein n=1 Tax=Acinetobacter pittii TaxID=48296 RepID=UPI00249DFF6B|nr:hypothetical protein [Acinetobacter pittii]WHA53404.1 hypothetical protein OH685_09160 [Acinetobacter pittii]
MKFCRNMEYKEQLLELILAKLEKIFSVLDFLEQLKAKENKQGKTVEQYCIYSRCGKAHKVL